MIYFFLILLTNFHFSLQEESSEPSCGKLLTGNFTYGDVAIPWATIIQTIATADKVIIPAALITPSIAITKASWFTREESYQYQFYPFNQYVAYVGKQTKDDTILFPPPMGREVTHIRHFPGFRINEPWWYCREHDLALIHLSQPIPANQFIMPICLPTTERVIPPGGRIWVVGWTFKVMEVGLIHDPYTVQDKATCESSWSLLTNNCSLGASRYCAKFEGVAGTPCTGGGGIGISQVGTDGLCYLAGQGGLDYGGGMVGPPKCTDDTVVYTNRISDEILQWIKNNTRCGSQNFTCDNGDCVPLSSMCDSIPECRDHSDEDPSVCEGFDFCPKNEKSCILSGKCVPQGESCESVDDSKTILFWIVTGSILIIVVTIIISLIIHRRKKLKLHVPYSDLEETKEFDTLKIWEDSDPKLQITPAPTESELEQLKQGVPLKLMTAYHESYGYVKIKKYSLSYIQERFPSECEQRVFAEPDFLHHARNNRNCPNVLKFYQYWTEPGYSRQVLCNLVKNVTTGTTTENNIFLMTELLHITFDEWLNQEHSGGEVINALYQISKGLQQLHIIFVIHMDVRPQNMMAKRVYGDADDENEEDPLIWKIIDLGLSRKVEGINDELDTTIIRTGDRLYLSPEKIQVEKVSMKSDVFSLGLVFLQAITEGGDDAWKGKLKIMDLVKVGKLLDELDNYSIKVKQGLEGIMRDVVVPMLNLNPTLRPDMGQIVRILKKYNDVKFNK